MKPHRIYSENTDPVALDQFYTALKHDASVSGALMADAHRGYSLPIGGVIATSGMVFPSWVGFDIGCGMCAVKTSFNLEQIRKFAIDIHSDISRMIPLGFSHQTKEQEWDWKKYPISTAMSKLFTESGLFQLGTLGGGNHFIEIGYGENDSVWFIIHSGSRGFGRSVGEHYMKLASGVNKAKDGNFGFELGTENGESYMVDQNFCLEFALENRSQMLRAIERIVQKYCDGKMLTESLINRTHNHAVFKDSLLIHRKGATHAEAGMYGVIPGNMRDGSFIVEGKGNPEALFSSSHGAGRVHGRKNASMILDLDEFEESMTGIVATVSENTLDESPQAYKNIFEVMKLQSELVSIIDYIRPIINVKSSQKSRK